jgi:hypothetical protein
MNLHFILCLERTGSSMLTAMLNSSAKIIAPSEEPFLLYFQSKYGNITLWTDEKLISFANDFFLLHDKNLNIYFETKTNLIKSLLAVDRNLTYIDICKQVYLNFYPEKDKSEIKTIIDKQIKYSYLPHKIANTCPDSKFIILTRNPLDNLASWKKRNLGNNNKASYLGEVWNDANRILFDFLQSKSKSCFHLKYEELAAQPESKLQEVCNFLDIKFEPCMLEFNKKFSEFTKKSVARDPEFIDRLSDFHSELHKSVNENNIGIYKEHFTSIEANLIIQNCKITAESFGYTLEPANDLKQKISAYSKFKSRWSRRYKLKIYFLAPFFLKRILRMIRKKKVAA